MSSPPTRLRVHIRPMRAADVASVAAIEAAARPRPWSPATFAEEQRRPDRVYLVAAPHRPAAGEPAVVGHAGALLAVGEAQVLTVAVRPEHRRRGVALQLLLGLLGAVHERGARAVTLEVRESNLAAQALYERLGFVPTGTRPGYYPDNGEAARILWLHELGDPAVRRRLRDLARARGVAVPAGP